MILHIILGLAWYSFIKFVSLYSVANCGPKYSLRWWWWGDVYLQRVTPALCFCRIHNERNRTHQCTTYIVMVVMAATYCHHQDVIIRNVKKKKNPIKSYTVIPKYLGFKKLLKFYRHERNYDLMVAPGPVIRNNHFQLLNMLWKCGSNSQIWINNNSNDDKDDGDSSDREL